jgi:hypothetical protein
MLRQYALLEIQKATLIRFADFETALVREGLSLRRDRSRHS